MSVAGGCCGLVALLASFTACASSPPREADVVAVVDAFYGAIDAGHADAAMRLIAPDAVFIESGKIETRATKATPRSTSTRN